MLTENNAADKGKGAGGKSAAEDGPATRKMKKEVKDKGPMLSLEDKRKIAYEWFVDPERSDINKFCTEVKDAPAAQGFVRKAMKQLDLAPLRKSRIEDEDIDGQVLEKLMKFRPNKAVKVVVTAEEKFDVEASKKLLIAFFGDEEGTPLPRFFRQQNAPHLIPLARKLRLKGRRARCREKNPKIHDKVMADIEKACDTLNISSDISTKTPLQKKKVTPMDDPHTVKALLVEWFDHVDNPSIIDFLKEKKAARSNLEPLRVMAKAAELFHLRKSRDDANAREKAMTKIDELFESYLKDRIDGGDTSDKDNIKKGGNPKEESAENMKTLLKEWFDDEEMIPLGKFLRKRNQFSLKKDMLLLVSQNRLKKLRRERDDPKAHALAMKRIERASFCEGSKDTSTVSADGSPEMKALLKEWFENDEMIPVGKFLRKRNKIELRDDLHSLIRQNRLKKLFKGRDDPKIQSLAMKRIEQASLCKDAQNAPSAFGEGASLAEAKKIKRKGATCSAPGAVKVCGLAVEAADQDIVRNYLKGWFCDYSRTSISDYLEAKGRLDLLPVMKRIVRKLDLCQLRREHHIVCKKANKKVDGVFKMKKGKAENDYVALKEDDKMPIPSAPPLDEGTLPEDFVDVVAADISKKMDIEEKEQLTLAAPMDTDDDESKYVSIAETTVVAKNLGDGK